MHHGRIATVVGSVLAVIGFGLKSAITAGERFLPELHEATLVFPSSLNRTFPAMWNENSTAVSIFVIALVTVLALSLKPILKDALSRMNALVVSVLGGVMTLIGSVALTGVPDSTNRLEKIFFFAEMGGLIPEVYTVSVGWGWYLLVLGGALAAIGGVLQLMSRPDKSAISD